MPKVKVQLLTRDKKNEGNKKQAAFRIREEKTNPAAPGSLLLN